MMRGVENKGGGGGVSIVNRMSTYDRLVLCKLRKSTPAIYVTVLSDCCALYIQLYGYVLVAFMEEV